MADAQLAELIAHAKVQTALLERIVRHQYAGLNEGTRAFRNAAVDAVLNPLEAFNAPAPETPAP